MDDWVLDTIGPDLGSSCEPEMREFQYDPLDLEGTSIRLLRLHRGTAPADIECSLFEAWSEGDDACPYEALSYTWGAQQKPYYIKISEERPGTISRRKLQVTANLLNALEGLRLPDEDRVLWVDAVCINQKDPKERGHQVQLMRQIYSRAENVIIWLGKGSPEKNVAMKYLQQLARDKHLNTSWLDSSNALFQDLYPTLPNTRQNGMKMLLDAPWFTRVWIIQEAATAKRAVVYCGDMSVSAEVFALAPRALGITPEPHCQAILDIMPGVSRETSWSRDRPDLYTLLSKFKGSHASDPRDMVYALLGIASDMEYGQGLHADYTISESVLVKIAAKSIFNVCQCPYHTMEEFLSNFDALDTMSFIEAAERFDADNRSSLLRKEVDETRMTEGIITAATGHQKSRKESLYSLLESRGKRFVVDMSLMVRLAVSVTASSMTLFIDKQGKNIEITQAIVEAAAQNTHSGAAMMEVLIKHKTSPVVLRENLPQDSVGTAAEDKKCGANIVSLLVYYIDQLGRLSTESSRLNMINIVRDTAKNNDMLDITLQALVEEALISTIEDTQMMIHLVFEKGLHDQTPESRFITMAKSTMINIMQMLLERTTSKYIITEPLFVAAAGNQWVGEDIMNLLLKRFPRGQVITPEVLLAAATNTRQGDRIMQILLGRITNSTVVTEQVIISAAENEKNGEDIMRMLLSTTTNNDIITELALVAAAKNQGQATEILNLFFKRISSSKILTVPLLSAAARNGRFGKDIMELLLEQRFPRRMRRFLCGIITDAVLESAASNDWHAKDILQLLLKENFPSSMITEGVLIAAAKNRHGKDILELLLKQGSTSSMITEGVLVAAADNEGSKGILELLLKQGVPSGMITKGVFVAAARNISQGRDNIGLLLKQDVPRSAVTEDVFLAAAINPRGGYIMEILLKRFPISTITVGIVITAARNTYHGTGIVELFLMQGLPRKMITEDVYVAAAENRGCGEQMLRILGPIW